MHTRRIAVGFVFASILATGGVTIAQRGAALSPDQVAQRWSVEKELQSIAVVERKVMMPMRDGIRLATDIYRAEGRQPPRCRPSSSARRTTSTSGTSRTACRAT